MKKIILIVLSFSMILIGCHKNERTVSLSFSTEDIECIELMHDQSAYIADDWEVLYTLQNNEIDEFTKVLCGLKVKKYWSPSGGLGRIFVCISYKDGSQDMIGVGAFKYISSTGEVEFDDWHYVYYYDMYDLFSKYIDEAELPSL